MIDEAQRRAGMEIAAGLLAAQKAATLQTAQYKIMAKQQDMQQELVDMLDRSIKAAPPPGQGVRIDKTA